MWWVYKVNKLRSIYSVFVARCSWKWITARDGWVILMNLSQLSGGWVNTKGFLNYWFYVRYIIIERYDTMFSRSEIWNAKKIQLVFMKHYTQVIGDHGLVINLRYFTSGPFGLTPSELLPKLCICCYMTLTCWVDSVEALFPWNLAKRSHLLPFRMRDMSHLHIILRPTMLNCIPAVSFPEKSPKTGFELPHAHRESRSSSYGGMSRNLDDSRVVFPTDVHKHVDRMKNS